MFLTLLAAFSNRLHRSFREADRGSVSASKVGPRLAVTAKQTPEFTYTKHWVIIEAATSAGTSFRYSTARGATASITVVARAFAWLAPKN